jgi:hypothetical protein
MVGRLDRCVLLSLRTPADSVEHLLPEGLELVRRGPYAFWNVVLCHVHKMRPAGVPEAFGMSYHHVAYRLLVQAMTDRVDTRRGLFFVRSDADAAMLGMAGNRLSDFRFHRADVRWTQQDRSEHIRVDSADGRADAALSFRRSDQPLPHPADSCFPTTAAARAALKYEPLGLSVRRGQLRLAEVFRDEAQWREDPIEVTTLDLRFFRTLGQHNAALETATQVAPLPYRWRLGQRERLLPSPTSSTSPAIPPVEQVPPSACDPAAA